jgi:hypothetical protein
MLIRSRNNHPLAVLILLAVVGTTFSSSKALAEEHAVVTGYGQQQAQQTNTASAPKRTKSPDYIKNSITDTVSMPDMPKYTGQTTVPSVSVTWDSRSSDRPSYDMTFDVRESPTSVLAWYKSAMQSYGWTLESGQQQKMMAATKNGRTCQVIVDDSTNDGYATQVDVFYR